MEPVYKGKVRDIYDLSNGRLVIVATDRVSAFDHVLPMPVKNKGVLLTRLSSFWFSKTRHIVPNHMVEERIENMPVFFQKEEFRDRTVMVEKLSMLPFEFVVRGYLFGSLWEAHRRGESICGITLPADSRLGQRLERPVLTPAVKRDTGHDEYVSMDQVRAVLGAGLTEKIAETCFRLYDFGSRYAGSRGLLLADAKFEFGQNPKGELVLGDELFTPDSSRYWDARPLQPGEAPASFDKQFLRDWLLSHRENGEIPFEKVPESILRQLEALYGECWNRLAREG